MNHNYLIQNHHHHLHPPHQGDEEEDDDDDGLIDVGQDIQPPGALRRQIKHETNESPGDEYDLGHAEEGEDKHNDGEEEDKALVERDWARADLRDGRDGKGVVARMACGRRKQSGDHRNIMMS